MGTCSPLRDTTRSCFEDGTMSAKHKPRRVLRDRVKDSEVLRNHDQDISRMILGHPAPSPTTQPYIVDEFLAFLGNILAGQTGPHIDDVVRQLRAFPTHLPRHALSVKVLNTITRTRASSS